MSLASDGPPPCASSPPSRSASPPSPRDWAARFVGAVEGKRIDPRDVFDFLAHPSCLGVVDPACKTIEMICDRVKKAGDKAELTDLETIARRVNS